MIHGFGVMYHKQGCPLYQGYWKGNKYDGEGILYNTNPEQLNKSFNYNDFEQLGRHWLYYRGSFKEHVRYGKGTIFLSNGEYFIGEFTTDGVDGSGEYHCLEGEIVKGIWKRNKLVSRL
jgi:hypothetical protein